MVQPGLDTSIILVADDIAVESFLNPSPGQDPWIWAVDVNFAFQIGDQPPRREMSTNIYPGYFWVALSTVVTELWPLLKRSEASGNELWNPHVSIWESVVQ